MISNDTEDSSSPPKSKKVRVDDRDNGTNASASSIGDDRSSGGDSPTAQQDANNGSSSSPSTGNVWKDSSGSYDNAWKWKHPQWGEFYNEEGECKWTDKDFTDGKYEADDEILNGVSTVFFMDDAYEDKDDYNWETQPPPLPNHEMLRQVEQIYEKARSGDLVRLIAQAFWDDWNGTFANGGAWWSGKKDTNVKEDFDDKNVPLPTNAKELQQLISLESFMIWENQETRYNFKKVPFFVWVDFAVGDSIIEEEHGLGAQFNGVTWECVGLSYSQAAC